MALVVGLAVLCLPAFWCAHLVQASGLQDLPRVGSGPLVVRSVAFVCSTALRLVRWLANMAYLAF